MMYTVSMTFGGILEYSGILEVIMNKVLRVVKSTGSLIATTIGTNLFTNMTCSEQCISIVVPSRIFAQTYKDKGLASKNLSRALEDGGTLTSVFVPWNTYGVFIYRTLGVHTFSYVPYAMSNFAVLIISIILACTGFIIDKIKQTGEEPVEA